jgi:hypothetical protein
MDVRVEIKYRLDLSRDEWLVVSKALRTFADELPRDEDREIAAKLQEQMLTQKHNVLSQMTAEASKAVGNIEASKRKAAVKP